VTVSTVNAEAALGRLMLPHSELAQLWARRAVVLDCGDRPTPCNKSFAGLRVFQPEEKGGDWLTRCASTTRTMAAGSCGPVGAAVARCLSTWPEAPKKLVDCSAKLKGKTSYVELDGSRTVKTRMCIFVEGEVYWMPALGDFGTAATKPAVFGTKLGGAYLMGSDIAAPATAVTVTDTSSLIARSAGAQSWS